MQHPTLDAIVSQLQNVLLGKPRVVKLALTCILARGHLLIEDLPGWAKPVCRKL